MRFTSDQHPRIEPQGNLLDLICFGILYQKYKDLYNSYGVTTLNSDHLVLNANTVRIQFTGKKGVDNSALITNKYMVRLLKQLKVINENREYLFTYRNFKMIMPPINQKFESSTRIK